MNERPCENSQTDPCPRPDTSLHVGRWGGEILFTLWLCTYHGDAVVASTGGADDQTAEEHRD